MDIKDFKGLSYFRYLVPAIYILSWIGMVAGHFFIPIMYRSFSLILYVFLAWKAGCQIFMNIAFVLKGNQALTRAQTN